MKQLDKFPVGKKNPEEIDTFHWKGFLDQHFLLEETTSISKIFN